MLPFLAAVLALGGNPGTAWAFQALDDLHSYEIAVPEPADPVVAPATEAVSTAWDDFRGRYGGAWQAIWDGATGTPRRLVGSGPQLVSPGMTAEIVEQVAREFIAENISLFGVSVNDLVPLRVRNGAGIWFVTYQQTHDGLPVVGGRVDLRFGRTGHLILASAATHPDIHVLTTPGLSPEEAFSRAVADFPPDWHPVPRGDHQLEILPYRQGSAYEYRLVYRLVARVEDPAGSWETLVDAWRGEVLHRTNLVRYATLAGSSHGDIQEATPTDPYIDLGLPDERLFIEGVGNAYTETDGSFSVEVPDNNPRAVTAVLDGRWIDVDNRDIGGIDARIDTMGVPGVDLNVKFDDSNSHPAERDAYYHGNVAHAYIKNIDPAFTSLDFSMVARVNLEGCGAFADPDNLRINFGRGGSGCGNIGQIADVIHHEYSHMVTTFIYQPLDATGAMHEGFADFLGNTITDQPLMGRGWYGPGTFRRNSDNNRQWPAPECGGEVHCVGEAMSGALWHMRENLIDAFGDHDAAVAHTDSLFYFAQYGMNTGFESYYFDLLVVDDDNGTLLDGTPNAIPIVQAFDRHNIGPGYTLDILHTPLPDSEDSTSVFPVVAVFSSPLSLIGDSLAVYHKTAGGPETFVRLPMTATGAIREYQAVIPSQSYGTTMEYYVAGATDTLGLETTLPAGAPAELFTFRLGTDAEAPVITHVPLGDYSVNQWPVELMAEVTDNLGVDEVALEFRINAVNQPPVVMTREEGTDTFRGSFTGSVAVNDVVEYRIRAADAAGSPNTSYAPPAGYYSFNIGYLVMMDAEDGDQGWVHEAVTPGYVDQWHISSQRNVTPGGAYSWKFGDMGDSRYALMSDGALMTPPMTLGPGASMTFQDSLDAAERNAGQATAWHGAVVEVTTDGGTNWGLIYPVGGYSHTIRNLSSPLPNNYPCWSSSHDWREEQFLLSHFEGERVMIRFRFVSDGWPEEHDGWFVDDIVIDPGILPTTGISQDSPVLVTGLRGVSPNPFNPQTTIRLSVASPESRLELGVYDISGRLVRQLLAGPADPGDYGVVWDGRNEAGETVPSGLYVARLKTRGIQESVKLTLLK